MTLAGTPDAVADVEQLEAAFPALDGATDRSTVRPVFDFAAALSAGAPLDLAREWSVGIQVIGGEILNAPPGIVEPMAPTLLPRACSGQSRWWVDAWGTHVRLDSCATRTAISVLQGSSSAAALAAALGGFAPLVGMPFGIYAGMAGYSAWSIEQCSRNGTGVELALAGFVCWAQ
ncbi:hypothetical protein [Leifsonia sp. Le1]|uniref:hypothetical protein n=1 Tax=Leifsonia sp. Le1 TaxID=3404918 RepID=UPI003EB88B1C